MNEKRSGDETVETNPEDLTLKTTANQYLLYYFPLKRSETLTNSVPTRVAASMQTAVAFRCHFLQNRKQAFLEK